MENYGIALILHSDHHLKNKIPSSRIFEAAATGMVVISDENAFLKQEFGNCVYYLDTNKSSDDIYRQIQGFVEEIKTEVGKASSKASCTYDILKNNYLLENVIRSLDLYVS